MSSQVDLSCEQMLAAQSQVLHDSMAYVKSMALMFAVELDIPGLIHAHGRPMPTSELISKFPGISPRKAEFLLRILRLLAQMDYFKIEKQDEDEIILYYSLTPLSTMLLTDNLRSSVLHSSKPKHVNTLLFLTEWFRSDREECVHDFVAGKSLWDCAGENPEYNASLNESMARETRVIMKGVVLHCKGAFEGLRSIVDVGGGTGMAARAIAQAFPDIKCTVYDLPHVISTIPESSLVEAIGGDMFEHIPRADAIFLKHILHDWTDEKCVRILKKCKKAIPTQGGKVIIIDMVLKDDEASPGMVTKRISDITMLTFLDGKEREEHEWMKLFSEAGFNDYKITPLGIMSLIELFP